MITHRRLPAPGPRLRCVPWTAEMAPEWLAIYKHPEVVAFLGSPPKVDLVDSARVLGTVVERNRSSYPPGQAGWALQHETLGIIGTLMVKPPRTSDGTIGDVVEIGWHLRRDCWGQGFATEAAWTGLQYAFGELGLDEIIAVVAPGNLASAAVALRLGMEPHGQTDAWYGQLLDRFRMTRARFEGAEVQGRMRRDLARAAGGDPDRQQSR